VLRNVYTSGWALTGAKGVLATMTMNAYDVTQTLLPDSQVPVPEARSVISEDVEEATLDGSEQRCGVGGKAKRMDWSEVDRYLQKARVA